MSKLIYLLGVTCSGKDWLSEYLVNQQPETYSIVQVGKIFRERYRPEYFQGSGAPLHTEYEAIQIYKEELTRCQELNTQFILINGQPRKTSQIFDTIGNNPGTVLWLHVDEETQRQRMFQRSKSQSELDLALQRVRNDRFDLYDVLHELCRQKFEIIATDTYQIMDQISKGALIV